MVVILCSAILFSLFSLTSALSFNCGTSVAALVTNGRPLVKGEYPWLVALYQQDKFNRWIQFCGGALLSSRIVLTAAHCVVFEKTAMKPEDLRVGLGKLYRDFYQNEDYATIANVVEIVAHPRFLGSLSNYALDVALLKLSIVVQMGDHILPVCIDLDRITTVSNGAKVYAAGWGTSTNGTSTERALVADLSYLDNHQCLFEVRESYRKYITHEKICSKGIDESQVDRGDSGGALTYLRNGHHFAIGIVSTKIIARTAFSIFTDLANPEIHLWIKEQKAKLSLPDAIRRCNLAKTPKCEKKYVLMNIKVNWFRAFQICAAEGKRLATITSREDQNNLWTTLESAVTAMVKMWISATDLGEEGKFVWMSTGQPMTYTNWAKRHTSEGTVFYEPSNSGAGENCVMVSKYSSDDFNWNDGACEEKYPFICEHF